MKRQKGRINSPKSHENLLKNTGWEAYLKITKPSKDELFAWLEELKESDPERFKNLLCLSNAKSEVKNVNIDQTILWPIGYQTEKFVIEKICLLLKRRGYFMVDDEILLALFTGDSSQVGKLTWYKSNVLLTKVFYDLLMIEFKIIPTFSNIFKLLENNFCDKNGNTFKSENLKLSNHQKNTRRMQEELDFMHNEIIRITKNITTL